MTNKINMAKSFNTLQRVECEVMWSKYNCSNFHMDVDLSAFICMVQNNTPVLITDSHFVFYNNKECPNKAVVNMGKKQTSDYFCEAININLSNVPLSANEISLILSINNFDTLNQNFGMLPTCCVTIFDNDTGDKIATFQINEAFRRNVSVQLGSLFKTKGEWKFKTLGIGYDFGLIEFVKGYGGNV